MQSTIETATFFIVVRKSFLFPFFTSCSFFVENLLFNAAFKCFWKAISLGALSTAFQKANHFFFTGCSLVKIALCLLFDVSSRNMFYIRENNVGY